MLQLWVFDNAHFRPFFSKLLHSKWYCGCVFMKYFLLASLILSRAESPFVFAWGINQLLQEKYSFLGAWKKRRYWTDFHSTLTKKCCLPEKCSTGAWCKQNKWYFEKFCMQKHSRSFSIGGLLRIHVSRVVRRLGGVRGSSTSCHSFMVSWGSCRLGGVRGRVLGRVGSHRHAWLGLHSHGLVALVRSCCVAGRHCWLLGIGRVNHGRGGSGHHRAWSSTCFVQTATGAGEAQNNSDDNHCKNRNSNGNKGSKTGAKV